MGLEVDSIKRLKLEKYALEIQKQNLQLRLKQAKEDNIRHFVTGVIVGVGLMAIISLWIIGIT